MQTAVVFRVEGCCFGLDAREVERVVPAVEILPLPQAPHVIAGLVNIHGTPTPVFDVRRRLDGRASDPSLSARLIVLRRSDPRMALLADSVEEVSTLPDDAITAIEALAPGAVLLKGAAPAPDGLILVLDPLALLSNAESGSLAQALSAAQPT